MQGLTDDFLQMAIIQICIVLAVFIFVYLTFDKDKFKTVFYILCITSVNEEISAYDLRKELFEHFNINISYGEFYTILKQMLLNDYITARTVKGTAIRGYRQMKMVSITAKGLKQIT